MPDQPTAIDQPNRDTLWSRLDGLLARGSETLNPILVKETRQALKSRQFVLWFVLLLVACWITTVVGVALVGPSIYYVSAGGYLLRAYYAVLLLPLTVVIPFNTFRSLAAEQEENTRDLLEVSTLTHWQIVNGKLGSAGMQMAMYLAALAPCIAFTYLLRGVDLATIALLLAYAVLTSIGLSACGLMLASTNKQRRGQNFQAVLFAGGLFFVFSIVFGLGLQVMSLDPSERAAPDFFWSHVALLSLYATTFAVIYVATAGLCTFASANRSTPLRVALVVQQAVFIAWIAGILVEETPPRDDFFIAFAIAAVYWFAAGAILTGEPAKVSHRVRRKLPQSLLGRALFSWFCPGPASGYVFAISNLGFVLILWSIATTLRTSGGGMSAEAAIIAATMLWFYVVGFLGVGLLLIQALRRVATLSLLGGFLVQVLLVLAGSFLPLVVQVFSTRARFVDSTLLQASSPVTSMTRLLDGGMKQAEVNLLLGVGLTLSLSVLLVAMTIAGREAAARRAAKPQRVLEDEQAGVPTREPAETNPWGDLA